MSDQVEAREGQRIAKVMARAGLCSRRDAEQWIAAGRVSVNGEVLASPAFNVSDADDVRIDGEPLRSAERTRLFLFHKPRGLVTTAKDPEGRSTIFDALPVELPRVVAVGRLDINTEGLLLLTNDGGLARVLELPSTGWLRRYRVRAHGTVTQPQLDALREGVTIDGIDYRGIDAKLERQQGSNVWLTMGLREGKNREIKRVLEDMGLTVNRLIRVSFGPFELADLPEGEVIETRTRVLRDQLGPKLARQAQANFDAPVEPALAAEPARDEAPPPRPEPPRGEPTNAKRKHVSVLRAESRADAAGPRKRTERATTTDRRGRAVAVERVSLANPPPAPTRERRPRRDAEDRPRAPRDGEARREREAPPRRSAGFAPRAPRGEGRAAFNRDEARPPRRPAGEGFAPRDRAPRGEGKPGFRRDEARPPRRAPGGGFAPRDRAPRGEGKPGFSRDEARPPRRPAGEGFAPATAPHAAKGNPASAATRLAAPRRAPGEGFAQRDRAPRGEGKPGLSRDEARPPRRAPGEGFAQRDRAPREGLGNPASSRRRVLDRRAAPPARGLPNATAPRAVKGNPASAATRLDRPAAPPARGLQNATAPRGPKASPASAAIRLARPAAPPARVSGAPPRGAASEGRGRGEEKPRTGRGGTFAPRGQSRPPRGKEGDRPPHGKGPPRGGKPGPRAPRGR